MARKSSGLDKKLLKAGRELLIKHGASGVSLREVARITGANLGMFNYHFKNKANFIRIILEEIYDEFLQEFKLDNDGDDLVKLRSQLLSIAKFSRDNRVLILSVLTDILKNDEVVIDFTKDHFSQHIKILGKTLKECQAKGLVIDIPAPLLITQAAAGVGLSNLVVEIMAKFEPECLKGPSPKLSFDKLTSDAAMELRVEMVMNGIVKHK